MLRRCVEDDPDGVCAVMGDDRATYSAMWEAAERTARRLVTLGVEPTDRVALLLPNRFAWFELFFAITMARAVQVPINPFLKGEFLRHQLQHCEPTVLVTDEAGLRAAQEYLVDIPTLRAVVTLEPVDPGAVTGLTTVTLADVRPHGRDLVDPSPDDVASILYTSGTTGLPKGCVLAHGYYVRAGTIEQQLTGMQRDDVFFAAMPLFHGGAQLKIFMPALRSGATVAIEPSFSPTRFLERAAEMGATVINGVGAMGMMLLASPPSVHDRAHRIRLANIAPLSERDQRAFGDRFGIDVWAESYGQTECVPVLSNAPSGPRDRGSIGTAVEDLDVALLDDHGRQVEPGEVGEICIRPRHRYAMFESYWRQPVETLAAFRGLWYHTGDNAFQRSSGTYVFMDRKKDSLRRRGENVSSIELELAIGQHREVQAVAVHAVSSDLGEDEIKACLVLEAGATLDPVEMFGWLEQHVPYFAVPRYVEVLEALPQNHLGRVQKHVLRASGVTSATVDFDALGLTVARERRR